MPHGRPNDNFLPNNFQERRMNHYPDSLDQQLEIASRNNRMFMRMFANRISGKEQTEVIPPLFKEAALLIKHDDFSEKEKLSLTYGMAHHTGCLVCQALLNKFGARAAIFPHLFLFNRLGRFPMVRYCPNLMRMPKPKLSPLGRRLEV